MKLTGCLVFFLTAISLFGQIVDLENFDRAQSEYSFTNGPEYPGASGTISWVEEGHAGKGGLKIAYDFSNGGNYVGWYYNGFFPGRLQAVSFGINADRPMMIALRLADATGQWHHFQKRVEKSGSWEKMDYPLPEKSTLHWGGKNDGKVYSPIRSLMIGVERPGPGAKGTVLLDDLQVTSGLSALEIREARNDYYWQNVSVDFQTAVPGHLFYPADKVTAKVFIPAPPVNGNITLMGKVVDVQRNPVTEISPITFSTQKALTATLTLPSKLGFYYVVLKVTDGTHTKTCESRYAVIPANPCLDRKEPESWFGVNTHFNQGWKPEIGKIVKRAGMGWVRDCEASPDDRAFPVVKENRLCYMPCFTRFRDPNWFKKDKNGKWDFGPMIDFHRQFARKYGSEVDYYDLINEPQNSFASRFGGDWTGGGWQKFLAEYGKIVGQAIKAEDPGAKILWEDGDIIMYYRHFYDLGVADSIDLISPHVYNMHRSRPLPEEQSSLDLYPEFFRFVREHRLPWKLWHGEVGFSSFKLNLQSPPPFYAPATELVQAQWLVRMMVVQLARGAEKIFWYDFMNDGWNPEDPEHNFGLIRNDMTPKPAVVAYAFLTHQLRQARWLGTCAIGGGADGYVYAAQRSGRPVLIAWQRRGQKIENVQLFGTDLPKEVTATDIFGRSHKVPITNRSIKLKLSETPIYIEGLTLEEIQPLLQPLPGRAVN